MFAQFNRFEIQLTKEQAQIGYHQGQCDEDITYLLKNPKISRQFKKIDKDSIRAELKEYGAWDEKELEDDAQNQNRIVWLAAANIKEQNN